MHSTAAYTMFETPFGTCGIAWSPRGLLRLQLPESTVAETRRRLVQLLARDAKEQAPPPEVKRVIDRVTAQLAGEAAELGDPALDLGAASGFTLRVYEALRRLPRGSTMTYEALAQAAGSPGAARAVGRAMATNPLPLIVPCHRVLAAGGAAGGFSAPGGTVTKARLLALEGVALKTGKPDYPFDAPAARRKLARVDRDLAALMRRVGPFRMQLKPPRSTFTALAEAIVYQQLTAKAAGTIFGRVEALFPAKKLRAEDVAGASDEQLRSAGLSRAKAAALRDLAEKSLDGAIPTLRKLQGMDDEAIVQALTGVRGIGRWTVEMLLIFQLGRPDVLPLADYGLRKGFARAFGGNDDVAHPSAMSERGERWRPYRTMASWYLWRALEL